MLSSAGMPWQLLWGQTLRYAVPVAEQVWLLLLQLYAAAAAVDALVV